MTKLKPCPFCGKSVAHVDSVANHEMMDEYEFDYSWGSNHYDVVCDYHNGGCGASIGKDNATPEDAIEAWNRRTHAADVAPVVRCRECKHNYEDLGGLYCSFGPCVDCRVVGDFYCALCERKDEGESNADY